MLDRTTIVMAIGTTAAVCLGLLFLSELHLSGPGPALKSSRTDAEIALDAGELDTETARDVLALKRAGVHVTLADIEAAKHDAPKSQIYAAIAEIDAPAFEAVNPRDNDHAPHHAICFAIQRETGVAHAIVYYNTTNFYDVSSGVYGWIRSGCADAVRRSQKTLSETAYMGKILALVPKDESHKWIRTSISGNMYMACGKEVRERFKGFSEERRSEMEMPEMQRCRTLSEM